MEWCTWDSSPALGDSRSSLPAQGILGPDSSRQPQPLTHILPSVCVAKDPILEHKVSL